MLLVVSSTGGHLSFLQCFAIMGDGGGEAVEAKGKEGMLHAELSLGGLPTENPPLLVG